MKNGELFKNGELDIESRLADLLSRLTVEEKISLVPTEQAGIPRLGIKPYAIGAEGAHGFVDRSGPTTTFPQTIGLASTWDRSLLRKIGKVIGTEARAWHNTHNASGCLSLWFPTIDMEKDPRWGRTEEGYGEDPHLAGELASEIIKGTQGDDERYVLASCAPKHFFANNNEKNRVSCSCSVDPRNMREYYLLPFRKAFRKGGARSLMTAYNEVNGIPLMQHPAVRDIVKGEWGLEGRGHIVTDGGDVGQTVNLHGYFDTHAETIAAGFKAGADSMTDVPHLVIPAVREALERGLITEADLDEHVGNVLRLRFRFGHFDDAGVCPYDAIGEADMMTAEARALAREAAAKSVVLLKNDPVSGRPVAGDTTDRAGSEPGIPAENAFAPGCDLNTPRASSGNSATPAAPLLPIAAGTRVAVVGPLADTVYTDWYTGMPPYRVSPLDGLRAALGADCITFASGRDEVSFRTADGRPLILSSAGELMVASATGSAPSCDPAATAPAAAARAAAAPARFARDDWGWGANTLKSLSTGKYLDTLSDIDATRQPGDDELAAITEKKVYSPVRATAESTFNWFITTLFNIIPDGSDAGGDVDTPARGAQAAGSATGSVYGIPVFLRSWNGAVLGYETEDGPVTVSRNPEGAQRFYMTIESSGSEEAAAAAAKADTVLIFAGTNPLINGKEEMDRPDLGLPSAQRALIDSVLKANPRAALVLVSGYPYTLDSRTLETPAILWSSHGMQEGGNGLADVLTGAVPPAGKLPLTWYRSAEDLPPMMEYDVFASGATYRHFTKPVLFPFGHGLTYSTFAWSGFQTGSTIENGKPFTLSVTLTNTGTAPAEEVVQLYAAFEGSRFRRPNKALAGFDRIALAPNESRRVTLTLDPETLEIWDVSRERYVLETGRCRLFIGASSTDERFAATVPVLGEEIPPRSLDGTVHAWNYDGYQNCHLHERRGSDLPAVFSGPAQGLASGYPLYPVAQPGAVAQIGSGAQAQPFSAPASIWPTSWIVFRNADFGGEKVDCSPNKASDGVLAERRRNRTDGGGPSTFTAQVLARSSMYGAPGIELRLGSPEGQLVGSVELPVTGDNCAVPGKPLRALWTGIRTEVSGLTGIGDLYIILKGDVGIQTFTLK